MVTHEVSPASNEGVVDLIIISDGFGALDPGVQAACVEGGEVDGIAREAALWSSGVGDANTLRREPVVLPRGRDLERALPLPGRCGGDLDHEVASPIVVERSHHVVDLVGGGRARVPFGEPELEPVEGRGLISARDRDSAAVTDLSVVDFFDDKVDLMITRVDEPDSVLEFG